MSKRVLIISSSPRKNGNSDTLCHSFAHGAKENGNDVIEIFTNNKEIHYCKGCGYCSNHDGCCQHDDMAEIAAACIDGLCDCLSNVRVKGIIAAGGVWNKGAVDNTKYIQQAYDMGYAV